jgi:cytidylate kinase
MIIAIDGPAASGKGTLAARLAGHFDLPLLDTGLLYRAVAHILSDSGIPLQDWEAAIRAAQAITPEILADPRLRSRDMGEGASVVAAMPDVRAALIEYQKQFAGQPGGAVLDGRDIGTVICPDADVKLFIIASVEERARRRFRELSARNEPASYEDILSDLRKRDERDSNRSTAPLKAAEDAIMLDTTNLDADETLEEALAIIDALQPN